MIDKLEMFIALAQERHFGHAALRIGVTQPTLSSAIKQLEETLGVQLVHRGSRFQGLTPEGERVYARALSLVADARSLRDEMRAVRSGLTGVVRIGVIPTALPSVADLTAPFAARHPAVRFSIFSRTSAEILDQIAALELDAGISYLDEEALRRAEGVALHEESYSLLVAAGDPRARTAPIGWAEVGRMELCLLTRDMQNRRIIDRRLVEAGIEAAPRIESNSHLALIGHVLTGEWATVVPTKLAELFTLTSALAAVQISGGGGGTVGLLVARRDPHTPVLEALIAEARRLRRG